jgi:hypothetical protein
VLFQVFALDQSAAEAGRLDLGSGEADRLHGKLDYRPAVPPCNGSNCVHRR